MGTEFSFILHVVEGVFFRRGDAVHASRAMVSPEECVACFGGNDPGTMAEFSAWLVSQGVDLEALAWKLNKECPGADAGVSLGGGVLIIRGCSVSNVVLASTIHDLMSRLPLVDGGVSAWPPDFMRL